MAAVRRSREKWCALVRAWEGSGQSAAVFAEAHGLRAGTLTWWRWKLSKEPAQAGFVRLVAPGEPRKAPSLSRDLPEADVVSGLEVELPTGCIVRFGGTVPLGQLVSFVRQLGAS